MSVALKKALEEAVSTGPAHAAPRASAVKAALDEHRDLIIMALAQGYTATGLAKKIKASGISTSIESLRQAIQAIVAASGPKPRRTKPKTTSAKPVRMVSEPTPALGSRSPHKSENKAFAAEDRTA